MEWTSAKAGWEGNLSCHSKCAVLPLASRWDPPSENSLPMLVTVYTVYSSVTKEQPHGLRSSPMDSPLSSSPVLDFAGFQDVPMVKPGSWSCSCWPMQLPPLSQWHQVSRLKSALGGLFTPQSLENASKQDSGGQWESFASIPHHWLKCKDWSVSKFW